VRQLVDVESARRMSGSDQHPYRAFFEIRQRLVARTLALVAVDGGSTDASFPSCSQTVEPCLVRMNTSTCFQSLN